MTGGPARALSLSAAGNRNLRRSRTLNAKKVQTTLLERQLQGRELLERPRDRAAPGRADAPAHPRGVRWAGASTGTGQGPPRCNRKRKRQLDCILGSARLWQDDARPT